MEDSYEVPTQYKYDNFVLLYSNKRDDIIKLNEYMKNTDKYIIRYKNSKDNNIIESESSFIKFREVYIDDLNMEEYSKKVVEIIIINDDRCVDEDFYNMIESIQNKGIDVYINGVWDEEYYKVNKKRIVDIEKRIGEENKMNMNVKRDIIEDTRVEERQDDKLNIVTYLRKIPENPTLYSLQVKCVLENYKNASVDKVVVIGEGVEEFFKNLQYERIGNKKIITIDDDDDNISFCELIQFCNQLFEGKMVMILRSDIILLNNTELNNLGLDFMINKKQIYCLSKIERDLEGKFVRLPPNENLFYSTEQDGWIFRGPIPMDENSKYIRNIKEHDFNEKYSELYFNMYMKAIGYELMNDIRTIKIIRITLNQNLHERPLLKKQKSTIKNDEIYLVPENGFFEGISVEQLLNWAQLNEEERYKMKLSILNKYFRSRLVFN